MDRPEQYETPTQFLALVSSRYKFLAVLNTRPYAKRGIEDTLNVSRSTVDRAFRELKATNLIYRTDNGYRTTLFGSTLTAIYDSFLDYFDHVSRANDLLGELPPDIDFDLEVVIDAEIVVADEPSFHAPAARIAELVEDATALHGLAYAHTSPEAIDLFKEQVLDADIPIEIVFRRQMYKNFKATHPDILDTFASAENYTAYIASGIPFGLFVLTIDGTDHICLIVYSPDQALKGIIVNDSPEAVAWGHRVFDRYRAHASPLSQEDAPE